MGWLPCGAIRDERVMWDQGEGRLDASLRSCAESIAWTHGRIADLMCILAWYEIKRLKGDHFQPLAKAAGKDKILHGHNEGSRCQMGVEQQLSNGSARIEDVPSNIALN